ncbi:SDR family oxidoreductase [Halomonas sp.]|uniref:SDR family oxidoreductase n=1 Tax=Halomonas sp. TaxID=1486246 RepID=UPI003A8DB6DE
MPLKDYKKVLVTGASSGIGAAVVKNLADAGLEVHALARNTEKLAALKETTGCVVHAMDVTNIKQLEKIVRENEFDILVNSAGVDTPRSIPKASEEDIDLLVDVNLRAVLQLCRLILPGMMERRRGHIVNISSIAGVYNFGGNTTYHATKAAVSMLSKQLRIDSLGHNVRVTEICPGRIATDIFANVHGNSEETRQRFLEGYDLPQASDVADAIHFAVSAPAVVNIGNIEIMPTAQVPGGLTTLQSSQLA